MRLQLAGTLAAAASEDIGARVLLFGDSNTWGARPSTVAPGERYPVEATWPYRLDAQLPGWVDVVVEGLGGRTTNFDPDPNSPIRFSGSEMLPSILASHMPVDIVVIMLGTNDLLAPYGRSTGDISQGIESLIDLTTAAHQVGTNYPAPKVLIVAPPTLGEAVQVSPFAEYFAGAREKSREFASIYRNVAERKGVAFLNADDVLKLNSVDGVHFDLEEHQALATAVEAVIAPMLSALDSSP